MIAFYSVSGEQEDVKFAPIVIFGVPSALAVLTARLFLRQLRQLRQLSQLRKPRKEIGCINNTFFNNQTVN
jgi:hypothetical protein